MQLNNEIPINENMIQDVDLLNALDVHNPELSPIISARDSGAINHAKELLVQHFYNRNAVRYLYNYRGMPLQKMNVDDSPYSYQSSLGLQHNRLKEHCIHVARRLMEHVYVLPGGKTEIDLGRNYENLIHFNYIEDQGKRHRHALDMFVRGQYLEAFAVLYHEYGEKEALNGFRETMEMFWENYALEVCDTGPSASRFMVTEDRDVMSVGWLTLEYTAILFTELPYALGTDFTFEVIKHLWFLASQFRRFDEDIYKPYNHHMFERGIVPFIVATVYPEFDNLRPMQGKGAEVIRQHILEDFTPDGGYSEHSIAYWSGAALGEMLYKAIAVAQVNDYPLLQPEHFKRIDNSFGVLAQLAAPGETYPSIGDNGGPYIDWILRLGVELTGNTLCNSALQSRLHTKADLLLKKDDLDYANQEVGFVISKNSYKRDSNMILMSAKTNCGYTGHNHMDLLALTYYLRGQAIYGEPYVKALYHNIKMDTDSRGFMYNMYAHNTVLAYGKAVQENDCYQNRWGVYRSDTPIDRWESRDEGVIFEGHHTAYTYCKHKRSVVFARNGNTLIRDTLERANRQKANHIQRWYLFAGVDVQKLEPDVLLVTKGKVQMLWFWHGVLALHIYRPEFLAEQNLVAVDDLGWCIDAEFAPKPDSAHKIPTNNADITLLQIDCSNWTEAKKKNFTKAAGEIIQAPSNIDTLKILGKLQ